MVERNSKWKVIGFLILTTLATSEARAADLPTQKAAPTYVSPPPVFSWTGFYAGLNVGGGFSANNAYNNFLGTNGGKISSVLGGPQAGYNYQISPMFVAGVEEDFSATGLSNRNASNSPYVSLPWYGTGRARLGVATLDSRLLFYGTGGMAIGNLYDAGIKKLRVGWTAGGGVEWAFMPNWSAKIEYLYTDFNHDGLPDWNKSQFHTIRAGVNYHFDLFSLMP